MPMGAAEADRRFTSAFPHLKLRFYLLAFLATLELSLLVAPISSPVYQVIVTIAPSRLPFQWIAFLREQWIVGSLAITQLYPLFYPATTPSSSGTDDIVKSLIGIDAKEAEGMKIALEKTARLADELEVINIRTFDKRRRLLTGASMSADPAGRSSDRMQEGEKLIKVLKREMENRAHFPVSAPFGLALTTLTACRRNSRENCRVQCWRPALATGAKRSKIIAENVSIVHISVYIRVSDIDWLSHNLDIRRRSETASHDLDGVQGEAADGDDNPNLEEEPSRHYK